MAEKLTGLIEPPVGFVSSLPPLLGDGSPVTLLDWDEIEDVARSGRLDGRKKYGTRFHTEQRHNNCAGASASCVLAKAIYDQRGEVVPLSNSYTYSRINQGRDAGAMLADAMRDIEARGVCKAETCGPDAIFPSQYNRQKADAEATRFRARECYAIRPRDFDSTDELKRAFWSALCLGFKAGIAIQAGDSFDTRQANGISGVDRGNGNHAVHCDGIVWIDRKPVATGQNTWFGTWNGDGRMLMEWAHFDQTIGVHEFYAVRTAIDDPQGQNPRL
jgi:hypothetical protein